MRQSVNTYYEGIKCSVREIGLMEEANQCMFTAAYTNTLYTL